MRCRKSESAVVAKKTCEQISPFCSDVVNFFFFYLLSNGDGKRFRFSQSICHKFSSDVLWYFCLIFRNPNSYLTSGFRYDRWLTFNRVRASENLVRGLVFIRYAVQTLLYVVSLRSMRKISFPQCSTLLNDEKSLLMIFR